MDQFYYQHEWTPTLRRRTRTEIEITQFQEQLEIIGAEIKLDALCLILVTVLTVHVLLILDRIDTLQLSLIYDAVYLILLSCGFIQVGIRLLGPSRESLKKIKDRKIRSRWITITIVACLIPALIGAMVIGIHLPTFALYPAALVIHELIILGSQFRHRHRVTREIRELQQHIQQESAADNLLVNHYGQPI